MMNKMALSSTLCSVGAATNLYMWLSHGHPASLAMGCVTATLAAICAMSAFVDRKEA